MWKWNMKIRDLKSGIGIAFVWDFSEVTIRHTDEIIEEKSGFVHFDGRKIDTLKCVVFCIQPQYVISPK